MADVWSKVEIGFYLPQGYSWTHYIHTDDRWDAIKQVMAKYPESQHKYVTDVMVWPCGDPNEVDHHARPQPVA